MANPGQELSSIDFESMLGGPLIAVVKAQSQAALSSVNFIKAVGFKAGTSQNPEATDTSEPIYVTFKYPKEVAPYKPAVGAGDGSIDLTLVSGGTGYTSESKVTIDPPPSGGTQATADAEVTDGVVTKLKITNVGMGYKDIPSIAISGGEGSGAVARATVNTAAEPAQIQEMKIEVPILTMLPIPFIRIDETTIDFQAKINSMEYQKIDTNLKIDTKLEAKQRWPGGSAKLNVSASYQRTTQQGASVDRTYSMAIHIKAVAEELPAGLEKILGILENAIRSQPVAGPEPTRT